MQSDFLVVKYAADLAFHNEAQVKSAKACGCYNCLKTFSGSEVKDWTDMSREGHLTALCPFCNHDTVLPGISDRETLERAHEYWLGGSWYNRGTNSKEEIIMDTTETILRRKLNARNELLRLIAEMLDKFEYEKDEDRTCMSEFKADLNEDWFFHLKQKAVEFSKENINA